MADESYADPVPTLVWVANAGVKDKAAALDAWIALAVLLEAGGAGPYLVTEYAVLTLAEVAPADDSGMEGKTAEISCVSVSPTVMVKVICSKEIVVAREGELANTTDSVMVCATPVTETSCADT